MIIGITGLNAAGKDTFGDYVVERGFYHLSLSDLLREELTKQGKPHSRENLLSIGNQMRSSFGAAILAELALKKLQADKNYVISSIRNPAEVGCLRQRKDFLMIDVVADLQLRYDRVKKRNAAQDKSVKSLADFQEQEKKELQSPDPTKQQLIATRKLAEVVVKNDGTFEEFYRKIDQLLVDWLPKRKLPRPDWDSYFMSLAKTAASRSNCMKRKVAAVIVKDRRIISTGYNGTPRGVVNCDEGGCPRCNSFAKSGTSLSECLCSHGEENAIVQASYHGASLKGATLYTTFSPCLICTKMIINSGIIEVIYNVEYPLNDTAKGLMKNAGVKMKQYRIE